MGTTSSAPIHHKWREIADLPSDLESFRDRELESLYQVWLDQRANVDEKAFAAELAREWSIETGIIEGVYTLDRGTTEILIRRGIDSSYISRESTNRDPALVATIISDHQDVLEGLFDFVAQRRELTTSYIKEVHAALLLHQDESEAIDQFGTKIYLKLKRGAYKEHPNSPMRRDKSVHEYCPPEHVASEMDQLVKLHGQHAQREIPAVVEAAWLHHAFTQIHPFQDGNGRVARTLASLVLIKGRFFPLVVHRDDWEKYIDALETADGGDLTPLVSLFGRLQKRDLTRAIVRVAEAKPVASVDEAVAVARDLLIDVGAIIPPQYLEAQASAGKLLGVARGRLADLANKLDHEIGRANGGFSFRPAALAKPPDEELMALAVALKYDPNPANYFQNVMISLASRATAANIVVIFQAVGPAFRGIIAVVAYFQLSSGPPVALSEDIFRIDYREPFKELPPRFIAWLDDCLIRGLAEWRKTLV